MDSSKLLTLIQRRHDQECELLSLVDSMASAASNMNPQNYDILLQSRHQFKEKLHEAMSESIKEMPFAY
jgi:hypothetical protein